MNTEMANAPHPSHLHPSRMLPVSSQSKVEIKQIRAKLGKTELVPSSDPSHGSSVDFLLAQCNHSKNTGALLLLADLPIQKIATKFNKVNKSLMFSSKFAFYIESITCDVHTRLSLHANTVSRNRW